MSRGKFGQIRAKSAKSLFLTRDADLGARNSIVQRVIRSSRKEDRDLQVIITWRDLMININ